MIDRFGWMMWLLLLLSVDLRVVKNDGRRVGEVSEHQHVAQTPIRLPRRFCLGFPVSAAAPSPSAACDSKICVVYRIEMRTPPLFLRIW